MSGPPPTSAVIDEDKRELVEKLSRLDLTQQRAVVTQAQTRRVAETKADPSKVTRSERIDYTRRLLTPDPKAMRARAIKTLVEEYDLPREAAEQDVTDAATQNGAGPNGSHAFVEFDFDPDAPSPPPWKVRVLRAPGSTSGE